MVLAHDLCNTTWWFCRTGYYISSHKGSCRDKTKMKELSGTRLDRLAKGAFVKAGSMV